MSPLQGPPISQFSWHNEPADAPNAPGVGETKQRAPSHGRQGQQTDGSDSVKSLAGESLRLRHGELVSSNGQPVASIRLYGAGTLADMTCPEGAWCLKATRKYGWELLIESANGRLVGWYSGRSWLPGGTIILTGGARIDLRRSGCSAWKLQLAETRERIVDIRGYTSSRRSLKIRSVPAEIYSDLEVVVLTACAVLLLWNSIKAPFTSGTGG